MRVFYYVSGALSFVLGLWGGYKAIAFGTDLSQFLIFAPLATSGGVLLLSAIRDFRGHWALPVALAMISSPVLVVSCLVDDESDLEREVEIGELVPTGLAAGCGLLLLLTAKHFNRMSKTLEMAAKEPNQHRSAIAKTETPPGGQEAVGRP